jgi:uncharacterized membrane protein
MSTAWELFIDNLDWMGWNLFLGFIPVVLSWVLFNDRSQIIFKHSLGYSLGQSWGYRLLWWVGTLVFLLFLPNAAYIVTDIIHLVNDIYVPEITKKGLILLIIPQYICFLSLGFYGYVLSVVNLADYLLKQKIIAKPLGLELGINLICAVGVYLGRFNRLNSWDVVTQPVALGRVVVDNLDSLHFGIFTLFFFGVITILYFAVKNLSQKFEF